MNLSISDSESKDILIKIHSRLSKNARRRKELFFKAFNQIENTQPWRRSRIMIVGQGKAGKTALVHSLHDLPFFEEWNSTIGVDLSQTEAAMGSFFKGFQVKKSKFKYEHSNSFAARAAAKKLVFSKFTLSRTMSNQNKTKTKSVNSPRASLFKSFRLMSSPKNSRQLKQISPKVKVRSKYRRFMDRKKSKTSKTSEKSHVRRPSGISINSGDTADVLSQSFVKKVTDNYSTDSLYKGSLENSDFSLTCSIWDYGGQAIFYTLHHLFLTQYGIYLVCFSMKEMLQNEDHTLKYLKFWLHSLKLHALNAPIFIVGTCLDLIEKDLSLKLLFKVNETVSNLLGQKFPQVVKNKMKYGHDKEKNRAENMKICFFPISNKSREGVINLRDQLVEIALKQPHLKFRVSLNWMIVLDKITQKQKNNIIQQLKEHNEQLVTQQTNGTTALDESETGGSKLNYIALPKLLELCKKHGIKNRAEMLRMLNLFHELGLIVHLTKNTLLSQTVITSPKWLINHLTKVIRDEELHSKALTEEAKKVKLEEDLLVLHQKGFLSEDLLCFLWEGELKNKEFLLQVMKHAMLLVEWPSYWLPEKKSSSLSEKNVISEALEQKEAKEKNSGGRFFLVPSMIKGHKAIANNKFDPATSNEENVEDSAEGMIIKIDFSENFLPYGIFERLICLLVSHSYHFNSSPALLPSTAKTSLTSFSSGREDSNNNYIKRPLLFANYCKIYLLKDCYLELEKDRIEDMIVIYLSKHSMLNNSIMLLQSVLFKIQQDCINNLVWKFIYTKRNKQSLAKVDKKNENEKDDKHQKDLHFDLERFLELDCE